MFGKKTSPCLDCIRSSSNPSPGPLHESTPLGHCGKTGPESEVVWHERCLRKFFAFGSGPDMKAVLVLVIACILSGSFPISAAAADDVVVGVNVTNNDGTLSLAFQEHEIKRLAENAVKTIRAGSCQSGPVSNN